MFMDIHFVFIMKIRIVVSSKGEGCDGDGAGGGLLGWLNNTGSGFDFTPVPKAVTVVDP